MQTWQLYQPGQLDYRDCWSWQQQLVNARKANVNLADTLILVEHPPIYTLGQGADLQFVKFDVSQSHVEVLRVERGGEVTYHAPGQLVAYPILNLKRYKPDLHWYLRQLESVVIEVLAHFGLNGERIPGLTGVWLEGHKVAALGIKVSQWITMHGFALNVSLNLQGYEAIVPCGIPDRPVGSLAEFIPNLQVEEVYPVVLAAFATIFNVQFQLQPFSLENLKIRPAATTHIAKSG